MTIHIVSSSRKDRSSEINWTAVGERLRELRGSVTQIEFGKFLGVPQNIVSRYEKARVRIPIEYLVAISKFANVSLDWLLLGRVSTAKRPLSHRRSSE